MCLSVHKNFFLKMSKHSVRWAFNFNSWNPTESELLHAISCLQVEEKERIQKFVFKDDFKASLTGRLLIRKFVHTTTGKAYNEIKLGRDERGKPVFLGNSDEIINFNVSHQGDYAVLAGEVGRTWVGVDVMKLEYTGGKDVKEFFRIMNRNFSPYEWSQIKIGSEKEQIASFMRHWCLKESYVKALGVGITIDLQDVSFKIKTDKLNFNGVVNDTELYYKNKKVDWTFEESFLGFDHSVAVALNNNDGEVPDSVGFEELTYTKLIDGSLSLLPLDLEYCKKYFQKMEKN